MAELIIHTKAIKENILKLSDYFKKHNIQWSLITKVFSGDIDFLNFILDEEVIENINSIGDSRLLSLRNLKRINPDMRTIYIKPPATIYADDVVKYADISLNTQYSTIKALNESAKKQDKIHSIIIMIELGEIREGVLGDDLIDFYERVFEMSNIDVIGIGSNLGCMYGVEPSFDKLLQLTLYKELISAKFNKQLKLLSGGSSIALPLIEKGYIPPEINHFRVGEAAFFGTSPLDNSRFRDLSTETFEFNSNIIELKQKPLAPDGIINEANIGQGIDFTEDSVRETSCKAILDFGMLDVNRKDIEAVNDGINFVGITSDMTVVDLGDNIDNNGRTVYRAGDKMVFKPNYMAVARLLNSKFIDKKFID